MEAAANGPAKKGKEAVVTALQEGKKLNPAQKQKPRPPKKPKPTETNQPVKREASTLKGKSVETATSTVAPAPAAESSTANAKRKRRKKEARNQSIAGESKSKDGGGGAAEDPVGKVKLKVVVRKLPPNVPEAVFWKAVSPWVIRPKELVKKQSEEVAGDDVQANIDYAYFVQGKLKDGSRRGVNNDSGVSPHTSSRAYIHFTSLEALIAFHKGFNGHLFKDSKGTESIAVVEFAPFQRMPSEIVRRKKVDHQQATIEDDADYKIFVASLEEKKADSSGLSQAEKTDAQLMSQLLSSSTQTTISAEKAKHTPLLDHLRAQHSAKAGSNALKNARSYLNRNNNAYAAATGKGAAASSAGVAASKDKAKGKGKGKVKVNTQAQASPASNDPSIPTGPKALRKSEGKNANKVVAASQEQQTSVGPKAATPKGPKAKAKSQGGSVAGKAVTPIDATANSAQKALLANDGGKDAAATPAASAQMSIPTGPSANREGAARGRGGGRRGGRGRGRGAPSATSNGND